MRWGEPKTLQEGVGSPVQKRLLNLQMGEAEKQEFRHSRRPCVVISAEFRFECLKFFGADKGWYRRAECRLPEAMESEYSIHYLLRGKTRGRTGAQMENRTRRYDAFDDGKQTCGHPIVGDDVD